MWGVGCAGCVRVLVPLVVIQLHASKESRNDITEQKYDSVGQKNTRLSTVRRRLPEVLL
jgi:hypothetical protein